MIPSELQFLANHLWQSTLFAAVAGFLTLALRKNRAQTRFWLWLAASVKFLIPFSLLVDLGRHLGWNAAPTLTPPGLSYVIEQATQPFTTRAQPASIQAAAAAWSVNWIPAVLCALWVIGSATLIFSWWRRWRDLRSEVRTASPLDLHIGMQAMVSATFAEPGVFGLRRPVLLLPGGITDRLTPPQLRAVVEHELCHIRRRDNLATAIHMGVEALFWFHPLVWWLGARLMEERERACDEEVLLMGNDPEAYAEGILKTCELCLEPSLPFVPGLRGANLRKRIEEIMSSRVGMKLSFTKKMAVIAAAMAAVAAPVMVGVAQGGTQSAREALALRQPAIPKNNHYEVVSIKRSAGVYGYNSYPREIRIDNMSIRTLIGDSFRVSDDRLIGLPAWASSERFSFHAKSVAAAKSEEQWAMWIPVLEERCKLKYHREKRQLPIYELSAQSGGIKFARTVPGSCEPIHPDKPPTARPNPRKPGEMLPPNNCELVLAKQLPGGGVELTINGVTMAFFANVLRRYKDHPVIDRTGSNARFDVFLRFDNSLDASDTGSSPALPFIDGALKKAGLRLTRAQGDVEVMVIDRLERPSEN